MDVQIFIKSYTGRFYVVALDDTEFQGATVLDLKHKFEALSADPVSKLIFAGRQLEDNLLLSHYGITNNATIHTMLILRGGGLPGGPEDPGLGDKDGKHSSNERLADFPGDISITHQSFTQVSKRLSHITLCWDFSVKPILD